MEKRFEVRKTVSRNEMQVRVENGWAHVWGLIGLARFS